MDGEGEGDSALPANEINAESDYGAGFCCLTHIKQFLYLMNKVYSNMS